MIKVSVLTASYNCDKYIEEAIRSVLKQTYGNWEMIILDDGSRDASLNKSLKYAGEKIKVHHHKQHTCCSNTYAELLSLATGDICCILDGDDSLVDCSIETIVKAYSNYNNLGFIYTQSYWCDSSLRKLNLGISKLPVHGSLLEDESKGLHCFSHWRTFRTELRDKAVLFKNNLTSAVDKALGYALEEVASGGFLDVPLYLYRRHANSVSSLKYRKNKDGFKNQRWEVINNAKKHRSSNNIVSYPIVKIT
jgi:glycosyltransferase involved in cell wall biosynthesis